MNTTIIKRKHIIVNGMIAVVIVAVIVSQVVWLNNMHSLYQREFKANVDEVLKNAIFKEVSERGEKLGGVRFYSQNLTIPNDTSRFFTKVIVTADSTYTFRLDKNDPNVMHKISQFVLKSHFPINLDILSSIFKGNIQKEYATNGAYFDYIDLVNDTLIFTNKPENSRLGHYVFTDTVPLDIFNSIGVAGYVEIPQMAILDNMKRQLILSILLIALAAIFLFYVSRSFVLQWKTEKMRQESVNAMTHEFKRPISGALFMISTIPLYLEKKMTNKVLEEVDKTMVELNKLTHYTKRIQQISNNESGKVMLDKSAVEIIPFFESLQQRYTNAKPDGKVPEVIVDLRLNTLKKTMLVDLLHFSNVMDNLVENAIKYTVQLPVLIGITVEDIDGGGLKISVKDNGVGISNTDRRRIFDKYYRVKRGETKKTAGFGLGLTYVKSIVKAHNGEITVKSEINNGSEFIIQLNEQL